MTTNNNHDHNHNDERQAVLATREEYDQIRYLSPRARTLALVGLANPDIIPARVVAERRHYVVRFEVRDEAESALIRRLTPWQRTAYLLAAIGKLEFNEHGTQMNTGHG